MPRFVVIERATRDLYGDTLRCEGGKQAKSPIDALCLLDRKAGRHARGFGHVGSSSSSASYEVHLIASTAPDHAVTTAEEALDLVERYGVSITLLVTYNS